MAELIITVHFDESEDLEMHQVRMIAGVEDYVAEQFEADRFEGEVRVEWEFNR